MEKKHIREDWTSFFRYDADCNACI